MFIIIPTTREISSLGERIAQTEKFFEEQYERTKELRKSVANIQAVSAQVEIFDRATIHEEEELRVITELEALAATYHISQRLRVNSNLSASAIPLPHVDFTFANQGAFADHLAYLRALEHLPYYVFIEQLQWEKNPSVSDHLVTLNFTGRIYLKNRP